MNKTKKTALNAIAMIINTAVISVLSLISTNIVLKNYGSDFNGVVATANQFVNLLLILEGGFTTAINVALFKPYVENDFKKINAIMSATKKTFFKIGGFFFLGGVLVSIIYPLFIKSNLEYITILLIFLMVFVGTAYNLIFVTKSQIMFQVSQKEYLYTFISIIINALSSITTIILAYNKVNMLIIRLFILIYLITNGIILFIFYKRTFNNIDTNVKPDYKSIKGTKDLMIQKLTSVVYLSTPLLFISTFISTKMASVYTIYSSIYGIIKNFLSSLIAAPVNGFGQLLSHGEYKKVYPKFQLYEYIVIYISTILIASVLSLILPFIRLYTSGIKDINYSNFTIASLIAVVILLEVIHIPSGNIINVTGNFKTSRRIQTIASIMLICTLSIGGFLFGIYGILVGTIITNIVLAYLEIHFAHTKIFFSNITGFLKQLIINIVCIFGIVFILYNFNINFNSYIQFFVFGFIILIINFITVTLINIIFFKDNILNIYCLIKNILHKK